MLLLSWKKDDLGVAKEIKALRHVFQDRYQFKVQEYEIPSSKPDGALKRRISDFMDLDAKNTLLILYYGGHARRTIQSSEASLWFASVSEPLNASVSADVTCRNRENPSPTIPSGGIQSMLEEADADVLMLFDCCHSATVPITDPR